MSARTWRAGPPQAEIVALAARGGMVDPINMGTRFTICSDRMPNS